MRTCTNLVRGSAFWPLVSVATVQSSAARTVATNSGQNWLKKATGEALVATSAVVMHRQEPGWPCSVFSGWGNGQPQADLRPGQPAWAGG